MIKSKLFNKNLRQIKKYDKLLYGSLIKYDIDSYEINNIKSEIAMDETKIFTITKNQYEWYFNSRFEPAKVAKDWSDKLGKIESIATITMFGLGNGLCLSEMMQQASEDVIFMVYEPSIDIFLTAMQEIDFSFYDDRLFIVVDGINDEFLEYAFQTFVTYENLSVCKFIGHPNYWRCFDEEAKAYLKVIQRTIKFLEINKYTKLLLAEGFYKNALMNIKFFTKISILDQIKNIVGTDIPQDFPAIIVSAGPSLSKNINELKKAKGKAFILATDSALVGLLSEGIVPDAFATIEPIKELNRFEDPRINNIPLICLETARYEILYKHTDKKFFTNNLYGYGNIFYNKAGIQYYAVDGGGSVATFSYSVLKAMGFKTIILVGQDLAFTGNTRYYDKVKEWGAHESFDSNRYVEVEDIYGGKVKTSKDLKIYIDWFETQIKNNEDIKVIDATEGGAKIHGSDIMSLSSAIKEKCDIEFDMTQYLRNVTCCVNEDQKIEVINQIKSIPKKYLKLYKDSSEGVELYKELINELGNNGEYNAIVELSKKIGKVTEKIENNIVFPHISNRIKRIEFQALSNLGISLEDPREDALQIAQRGWIMLETITQVLNKEELNEVKHIVGQTLIEE